MAYNQTYASTTGLPLSSSDTAMLEALVPGYTFFSRIAMSYLKIDLTAYLGVLVSMTVLGASLRYSLHRAQSFFKKYFVSTAEIRLEDEVFRYLMYWLSRQAFMKRTNRVVAGVKSNGYWNDDDEGSGDEDMPGAAGGDDWDEPGSGANARSFDDFWAKLVRRDKYRRMRFTPAQGRHIFWFRGQPLMLEREERESPLRWVLDNERLYLSCLGRNPAILKALLAEAQQAFVERDANRTIIYRGQRYSDGGSTFDWIRCMARSPRPLSTVVLDHAQKQAFVDDIKEYLHPRTRRWYSNRGIPYRRGYLLHGPPGTGKTSLCFAAAGLLGLKLYLLNLNSRTLDEDSLAALFSELPRRCIILLEDVDTAGITHNRGKTKTSGSKDDAGPAGLAEGNASSAAGKNGNSGAENPEKDGITLSGLLNVIDGVAASEGRILVMTTNHADKLDAALLRPGRVDMSIVFGYTTRADIEELFTSIYVTMEGDLPRTSASRRLDNISKAVGGGVAGKRDISKASPEKVDTGAREKEEEELQGRIKALRVRINALAAEFASVVPSGELTAAEIQGYLLMHKDSPESAISGVAAWVSEVQEKKRSREEKLD